MAIIKPRYYSLKQILSKNAQYNIIIGERSNGKTYACLEYGLKQYAKTGKQFAIVRRFIEDFKGRRGASMFDAHVTNGVISKLTGGKWDSVYYYSQRWYLCKHDDRGNRVKDETPFCYGFTLSTSEHDKGNSYPNITTVVFDEFITRSIYLGDEFTIFTNLISTIIRQRTDVKIFMLGNTVNKYGCPYVDEMGLKHFKQMKQGDIDLYRYGESDLLVAVEYCKPNKEGKPNNYYFAFDNPKLAMITGGAWEIDIYPHLPEKYKPKNVALYFYINYSGEWLCGEIIITEKSNFLFIRPQTKELTEEQLTNNIIFTTDYNPLPNYFRRITEPKTPITKKIAQYIFEDKVFFANNECGEILRNYLMWCTKSEL